MSNWRDHMDEGEARRLRKWEKDREVFRDALKNVSADISKVRNACVLRQRRALDAKAD